VDKTWGFKVAQAIVDRGKKEKGAGMTQDEIMQLAKDAGLRIDVRGTYFFVGFGELSDLLDAAITKEREACAKVVEHQPHWVACAAAIRARGDA
jgi:hypothetical protein